MNNAATQYRFAHLIDMSHPYVPANETDIRKTFEKEIAKQDAAKPVGKKSNVARMQRK
jgi:hypothetical protein